MSGLYQHHVVSVDYFVAVFIAEEVRDFLGMSPFDDGDVLGAVVSYTTSDLVIL
jgi:hypothetical protein